MEIIINSDHNVETTAEFKNYFEGELEKKLKRFEAYITRYEVFFSDESSNKDTINDHKCVIEARVKGKNPERVSANGDTTKKAFDSAVDKIRAVLDKVVALQRNH